MLLGFPLRLSLEAMNPRSNIYRALVVNPGAGVYLDEHVIYARNFEVPSGNGVGTYPFGSIFFRASGIAIDANHRVYMAGFANDLPVFRVRPDGSLATGFGDEGLATNPASTTTGWDVMLQGNLVLVAGGLFPTSINATRYLT